MEHLIDAIYMWLMAEILRENIFYSFLYPRQPLSLTGE